MLYFIPTPIGNLEDISFRAISVLKTCKTLFCEDTRVTKSLINLLNDKYNAGIFIDTFIPLHTHNEDKINIDNEIFNSNVAYLSDAGMPGLSDPGEWLVNYAIQNNIDYEVLPGANAALVALISSGFCKKEFNFIGFLNIKKDRLSALEKILFHPYPSIIYESKTRLLELIDNICEIDKDRDIFCMKEISKKYEKKYHAKAEQMKSILKDENLNGEWVVVVNGKEIKQNTLNASDILSLSLPPKITAKLLAKLNKTDVKLEYEKLLKSK